MPKDLAEINFPSNWIEEVLKTEEKIKNKTITNIGNAKGAKLFFLANFRLFFLRFNFIKGQQKIPLIREQLKLIKDRKKSKPID